MKKATEVTKNKVTTTTTTTNVNINININNRPLETKIELEKWKTFKTKEFKFKTKHYQISNFGNVRCLEISKDETKNIAPKIKKIKTSLSGGHYNTGRYKCLPDNNFKYVHRLVGEYFVANPNNYPTIDHIDNNKENNHYTNLRWCTHKFNLNRKRFRDSEIQHLLNPFITIKNTGVITLEDIIDNLIILKQRLSK